MVSSTEPQVFYNNSTPEAHNIEEYTLERGPSPHTPKPVSKQYLMVMMLFVAVAVAIGVEVGVWRHREHTSYRSTAPRNPVTTSSPSITSAAQYILYDTYLAAIVPRVVPPDARFVLHRETNDPSARTRVSPHTLRIIRDR